MLFRFVGDNTNKGGKSVLTGIPGLLVTTPTKAGTLTKARWVGVCDNACSRYPSLHPPVGRESHKPALFKFLNIYDDTTNGGT